MPTARIVFRKIIINNQEIGMDDPDRDYLHSTIHFDAEIGGKRFRGCTIDAKQPRGCDYAIDPLEFGPVKGIRGPFALGAFSDVAEAYYRDALGPGGWGLHYPPGAREITLEDFEFVRELRVSLEFPGPASGW